MGKQTHPTCLICLAWLAVTACAAEQPATSLPTAIPATQNETPQQTITRWGYEIINTYPHDPKAFTQGLVFQNGRLLESTGQYGHSTVRHVALETGTVLKQYALPDSVFGEGITIVDDQIFGLTWKAQKGFVLGGSDFQPLEEFRYQGEGWGLTYNGTNLIMSNGSDTLKYFDSETGNILKLVKVTFKGEPLYQLNELEWVQGAIFANIWQTDFIVRIDPISGVVTGVANLAGLLKPDDTVPGETDVLNGIAYDAEQDRLLVTGKNWPKLFEIKLIPLN